MSSQSARRTSRTIGPGRPRTAWQKVEKSCTPRMASQAVRIALRSKGAPTCQVVAEVNGAGHGDTATV